MKKMIALVVTCAMAMGMTVTAWAVDMNINLKNKNTSLGTITEVYVTESGAAELGDNVLQEAIAPGSAATVQASVDDEYCDVVIIAENGAKLLTGLPTTTDKISMKDDGGASVAAEALGIDYVTTKDGQVCNSDDYIPVDYTPAESESKPTSSAPINDQSGTIAVINNGQSIIYSDDTYKAECEKAAANGYVINTLGLDFTKGITREQFCKLAVNMVEKKTGESLPAVVNNPFTDTTDTDILKAVAAGITNGTSATTFEPSLTLTRQELATMLSRALDNLGVSADEADMSAYTDWAQVDSWAKSAVAKMSTLNVMKGTSATTLEPTATCTIEQGVLLVSRAAAAEAPASAVGTADSTPADETAEATDEAEEVAEITFTLKNKESLGSINALMIVPAGGDTGGNLLDTPIAEGDQVEITAPVVKTDYVDIILEFDQGTRVLKGVPLAFDKVSLKDGGASIADEANDVKYVTAQDGSECNSDTFKFAE